ncbi:MAG: hypothetical protein ACOYN0_05575 [Phycisphaerales bacterium]
MRPIELESDRMRLRVLPELGAGVFSLEYKADSGWCDVWRPSPESPATFNELACYTLAPWCNRIDGAVFEFDGRTHELTANWHDGTAIHGDVHHREWQLTDRSPVSARLEVDCLGRRNWPWPFRAGVRYELSDDALLVEMSLENAGATPMPFGLGLHPFWMKRLGGRAEEAVVRMPTSGRYPCERIMATGPSVIEELGARLAVGTTIEENLDDVFSGFDFAEVRWPASGVLARMEAHPSLSHSVIFHEAGRDWFCLEPVSMVNNGIALRKTVPGTGVQVLNARSSTSAWARFSFISER